MAPSNAHVTTCECRPVVVDLGSGDLRCATCARPVTCRPSIADRRCAERALRSVQRSLREIEPVADGERRQEIERSLLDAADLLARLKHGLPPRRAPA